MKEMHKQIFNLENEIKLLKRNGYSMNSRSPIAIGMDARIRMQRREGGMDTKTHLPGGGGSGSSRQAQDLAGAQLASNWTRGRSTRSSWTSLTRNQMIGNRQLQGDRGKGRLNSSLEEVKKWQQRGGPEGAQAGHSPDENGTSAAQPFTTDIEEAKRRIAIFIRGNEFKNASQIPSRCRLRLQAMNVKLKQLTDNIPGVERDISKKHFMIRIRPDFAREGVVHISPGPGMVAPKAPENGHSGPSQTTEELTEPLQSKQESGDTNHQGIFQEPQVVEGCGPQLVRAYARSTPQEPPSDQDDIDGTNHDG